MKRSCHFSKGGTQAWAYVLVLIAVIPFSNLGAQNTSPSFDELAQQATAARDVDDTPRATELYTRALQLNPGWEDGWWSLGLLQYGSGSYASASDAFSHLLALSPQSAPALALRGLCEFELGDFPQSLADIRKGLTSGAAGDARQEQILRYHEAMLMTRLGNFSDALKVYSAFAEHKISSPELLMGIGLAGLHIPLLPKDVAADQQDLLTAVGDATFTFMQGNQEDAQRAFNDLFQRFPTARNAHALYGNLLSAFGPEAATPQFKEELKIAPDNKDARAMLTWSLLMQHRPDEALPYARRIAQEEPGRAVSQLMLGRALLDTGDIAGGIERLESALKLDPANLEVHIALARAYSKSGRDEDARRERTLCLQMTRNGANELAHP